MTFRITYWNESQSVEWRGCVALVYGGERESDLDALELIGDALGQL